MTHRDVHVAVYHCELVADTLAELPELGRTNTRRRDTVERVLGRLTDTVLADLDRRGRFLAAPDGYPARSSGSGDAVRGGSELTSVEAAVCLLTGEADRVDGHVRWSPKHHNDNILESVQKVFGLLEQMARTAITCNPDRPSELLRPLAGMASNAERALDFVVYVNDKARGRVSTLAGPCQCCGRQVAGTERDRMRSGMCHADYTAWCRDGRPERAPWMESRRLEKEGAA